MDREEAIKVASEMYGWLKTDREKEALETLIPELAESEDERIRMALVEHFATPVPFTEVRGIPVQKVRNWLEKQKEQNLIMANSPQLKEQKPVKHPKMVEMLREHLENTPKEQLDVEFEELKNWNDVGPTVEEFFHGKPIEWNEKDEKMRACAISLLQISRDSGMAINPGFGKPVRAINKCIDWLKSLRPSWKPSEVCYGAKGDPDPAGVWKPSSSVYVRP